MSGAVAAHAAYNGSGTQGLAVTNKIHDDDGDVMSVFWNKNDTTRQLLYGSSIIEIPSSGASNISYGSSRLFTVNNDIDCLGDMYLQLEASLPTYYSTSPANQEFTVNFTTDTAGVPSATISSAGNATPNTTFDVKYEPGDGSGWTIIGSFTTSSDGTVPVTTSLDVTTTGTLPPSLNASVTVKQELTVVKQPFSLQSLIERVEFQVGTQIWQTIENQDLRVVNSTELSPDAFYESSLSSGGDAAWLVIPSLTKTLGPALGKFTNQTEDGYPMAAAPHQSVKIKVTLVEVPTSLQATIPFGWTQSAGMTVYATVLNSSVFSSIKVKSYVSSTDGAFPLASGSFGLAIAAGGSTITTPTVTPSNPAALNLFAKQQIMCNEEREQMKAMPMGLPKRLKMTQNSYTSDIGSSSIKTIELDHFSLYASHLIISGNAGIDTLGKPIRIKSAELKLNSSSFSGQLPGVLLDACTSDSLGIFANKYLKLTGSNSTDITVDDFGIGTYVFPLSSTAYSGSCVPLNRFDSIRLTLTFTSPPTTASSTFVNVTCVGETTALFKGGAASLAMY